MDIPSRKDLGVTALLGLQDYDVGDSLWVPVSPIRGDKFRAYKITIEKRASAGGYERDHAIDKWSEDEHTAIEHAEENHRAAEGHDS